MLKSMTGYGRYKWENDARDITIELKAVNHRYLDTTVKISRLYGFLEDPLKKAVAAGINRGKVDLFVTIHEKAGEDTIVSPNMPMIEGYMKAMREVRAHFGADAFAKDETLTPLDLIRLPDSITVDKEELDVETLTAQVLEAYQGAFASFDAMRKIEGENLCADLLGRADRILEIVSEIAKRSPVSVKEYREKLLMRMKEILDGSDIAEQRILTEAAIFADKVSVTEEIVRLKSHVSQLKSMLQQNTALGRKLDFLVQELNREANTIGSKANDYDIAKDVVELKAEIEKIREQIQNLE